MSLSECPACGSALQTLYRRTETATITYTCEGSHLWVLLDQYNERVVVIGEEACTFQFNLQEVTP